MAEPDKPAAPAQLRVVKPAPTAPEATDSATADQPDSYLRLANLLHSTLDPHEALRLFAAATQRELPLGGINYRHDALEVSADFGVAGRHRAAYRLEHEQTTLGELTFSREQPFSKRELMRLERLLTCLIPALRNALQYLGALRTATRDALTGAGNRSALEIAADREIALARRNGQPCAILVIDIDHFKHINDQYGHSAGDRVLVDVAQHLYHSCRESDAVFRFGGEEFVVLLSQTDEHCAMAIAERIRTAIAAMTSVYQQQSLHITVSIGIAGLNHGESLQVWFERADQALYQAKQAGRNRVVRAAQRHIA
jgi:diguanylate cyclase (GGDEF)-like protein